MFNKIIYAKSYNRGAEKFVKKYPELIEQYKKTLKLLELNPFNASLKLHRLSGKLSKLFAISINISFRITLELLISEKEIIPINIGIFDDVYK
ncbi:MAG: plasmid stabilization protein [Actinobacteria bacterium]|nr:plasmid stabilization protein [Actinomycetota bacterium]